MKIYIYAIYFPTSDKYYIGQTNNLTKRMLVHVSNRDDSLVGRAFQKYDDWKIIVLHIAQSRDVANTLEIEEIRNFNAVSPYGYNLTHGGEGGTHCEETRQKMSVAKKGEKNPNYGKHHSKETLKKIKDGNVGKHRSEETRAKIVAANKDKSVSKETRKKLSDALKGNQNTTGKRWFFSDKQRKIIWLKKLKTRLRNLEQETEGAA